MIIRFSFIETLRSKNILWGYLFLVITLYIVELSFWGQLTKNGGFSHYSHSEIKYYILWSVITFQLTAISGFSDNLCFQIENGSIEQLIILPKPIFLYYSEYVIGQLLARIFILSPIITGIIFFQKEIPNLLILFFSLTIGILINLYLTMLLSCLAFKFRESYAFVIIKDTLAWVLSGALIPLDIFNKSLQTIFNFTPFQYITFVPVKVATNQYSITLLLYSLLIMLVLLLIFQFIWKAMVKLNQGYNSNA